MIARSAGSAASTSERVAVALLWHVWVGMRDVLMDYVKPVFLRLALQVFVIVWLTGCAGWAVQVLWRV